MAALLIRQCFCVCVCVCLPAGVILTNQVPHLATTKTNRDLCRLCFLVTINQ